MVGCLLYTGRCENMVTNALLPSVLLKMLLVLLTSPKLNLRNSGDSLLEEEDGSLRTTGRRTTGTAESGMRMLLQWRAGGD